MNRSMGTMVVCLALLAPAAALADDPGGKWNLQDPASIEWKPAATLPPGAMMAVLEGDPSKEGFFTMRLKMPDGYKVPPHWHTHDENITVLQGTLLIGKGDAIDLKTATALPVGSFMRMPSKMRHYAVMKGETILQVHGAGPFDVTYVNASDDPRKK